MRCICKGRGEEGRGEGLAGLWNVEEEEEDLTFSCRLLGELKQFSLCCVSLCHCHCLPVLLFGVPSSSFCTFCSSYPPSHPALSFPLFPSISGRSPTLAALLTWHIATAWVAGRCRDLPSPPPQQQHRSRSIHSPDRLPWLCRPTELIPWSYHYSH